MPAFNDITGKRFGRWTAVEYIGRKNARSTIWICHCDCGQERFIQAGSLTSGKSRSCGCLKREISIERTTKHGMLQHPLYHTWCHMRHRCRNHEDPSYKNYGGRGIDVCERWNDFALFVEDVGERPSPKHTIDRIDNDRGYEPNNVRWATRTQQNNNQRRRYDSRLIAAFDQTFHVAEWARRTCINENTIRTRLKAGWPPERALTP